jgi:hypothetical protein
MAKKEFSKFFIGSLKRTAQNVSPLVIKKQKLIAKKSEINAELELLQSQIEQFEAPIKDVTGGYGTEDLVERVVETTDKVDKDGKPIKVTKWCLRYPETIIPIIEETPITATACSEEESSNSLEDGIEAGAKSVEDFEL